MSILTKTFGVEIECLVPGHSRRMVADALTAAGVAAYDAGYTHQVSGQWKIVSDGSVTGDGAMEVVSPVLSGEAGFTAVTRVCAVLGRLGARVNSSCGLHVHVGARDLSINAMRRLVFIYGESELVIDSLLPVSRRANNNHYCRSIRNVNLSTVAMARDAAAIAIAHGGRYCKLNFVAFSRHSTVEFRQHSGTVDAVKINNWVKFCMRMVATAQREQDQAIATPATRTEPQGNLRLRRIYNLVSRPEGASRDEVAAILGRRTSPPLAKILTAAGIAFTVRRGRYYVNTSAAFVPVPRQVQTLATMTARLEMPAEEAAFWQDRQAMLVNQPMAQAA